MISAPCIEWLDSLSKKVVGYKTQNKKLIFQPTKPFLATWTVVLAVSSSQNISSMWESFAKVVNWRFKKKTILYDFF